MICGGNSTQACSPLRCFVIFFFGYCLFIDNFNHRLAKNPQNEKMQSKNKIVNLDLFIDWAERKSESGNIMLTLYVALSIFTYRRKFKTIRISTTRYILMLYGLLHRDISHLLSIFSKYTKTKYQRNHTFFG